MDVCQHQCMCYTPASWLRALLGHRCWSCVSCSAHNVAPKPHANVARRHICDRGECKGRHHFPLVRAVRAETVPSHAPAVQAVPTTTTTTRDASRLTRENEQSINGDEEDCVVSPYANDCSSVSGAQARPRPPSMIINVVTVIGYSNSLYVFRAMCGACARELGRGRLGCSSTTTGTCVLEHTYIHTPVPVCHTTFLTFLQPFNTTVHDMYAHKQQTLRIATTTLITKFLVTRCMSVIDARGVVLA